MAFILYLPGGMAELVHRAGDLLTAGIARLRAPPSDGGTEEMTTEELVAEATS
jgi:hypothetical protein